MTRSGQCFGRPESTDSRRAAADLQNCTWDVPQEIEERSRACASFGVGSVEELIDEAASLLVNAYGLSILSVDHVRIPEFLMKVTTQLGSYYLKVPNAYCSDFLAEALDLADYYRESEYPVPAIALTDSGARIAEFRGHAAYLMQAVSGRSVRLDDSGDRDLFISAMAGFHNVGDELARRSKCQGLWSHHTIAQDIRNAVQQVREQLLHPDAREINRVGRGIVEASCAELAEASKILNDCHFCRTHIHGDFKPRHVLLSGSRIAGVIDFETAGYGERMRDVCFGMGYLLPLSLEEQYGLIEQYNRVSPLTREETNLSALILLWANLMGLKTLVLRRRRGRRIGESRLGAKLDSLAALIDSEKGVT